MKHTPRIKDIIEWDQMNWSHALYYWKKNATIPLEKSFALDLGARNGGLSLWLASQGARVVCSDLTGPTNQAKELHRNYKVENKISYTEIDATSIPYKDEFDIVLFKSMLGGIGRNDKKELQLATIKEIYKSLKPGGELFFAENLRASPIHQFFRKKFIRWGSEWRYVSIQEMKEFTVLFSNFKYKTVGFLGAFGRTEWQRMVLGILDKSIFNFIVPKSWRYIIIGIARK